MKPPVSPCPQYCEKRGPHCRSGCEAWQQYEQEKEALYAVRKLAADGRSAALAIISKGYRKTLRGNQRGPAKRMGWKQ